MMRKLLYVLCIYLPAILTAQQWVTPVIEGYGKIKYSRDVAVQPDTNLEYKMVYKITTSETREGINKGLMDAFDEITYNAEVWLPGTDSLGNSNGSVRTYGVWTAKNPMNGNVISTNAYHSFEFNAKGQIHEMRDYFDASGAMAAAMKGAE